MACWIAGFDIIYALLDLDFDRAAGIHSIPARFGAAQALWVTRGLHAAALALLVAAGLAAGAGAVYMVGVGVCGAVLAYENTIVGPATRAGCRWPSRSRTAARGRLPDLHPARGDAVAPTELVPASGLVKRFGDRRAVDGVDVRLSAGECLAVLGPNGAARAPS